MRSRPDDWLRQTAIHEAGHAIAACALGLRIGTVSISPSFDPSDSRLGYCYFHAGFPCGREQWWRLISNRRLARAATFEAQILALRAGRVAEGLIAIPEGSAQWDNTQISWLLSRRYPGEAERMAAFRRLDACVGSFVARPKIRELITAVADRLFTQHNLSPAEVHTIIKERCGGLAALRAMAPALPILPALPSRTPALPILAPGEPAFRPAPALSMEAERAQQAAIISLRGAVSKIDEPWPACEWSQSFRIRLCNGDLVYLKGSPRVRLEADITTVLRLICPEIVPWIMLDDLLPNARWRWFLIEDAGGCCHGAMDAATAKKASFTMGNLQRRITRNRRLLPPLPQCRARHLQEVAIQSVSWAIKSMPGSLEAHLRQALESLTAATDFFRRLGDELAIMPATCVHGDFSPVNIAISGENVRIIDWADAFWGPGGLAIPTLIGQAGLEEFARSIWRSYGAGLGAVILPRYIAACETASLVASLQRDAAIAQCCGRDASSLPGFIRTLDRLIGAITA